MLDDLHDAARRLDDRLCSIERIMTAENPDLAPAVPAREPSRQRLLERRRSKRRWPSLQAAPDSTATSATARSWASAPGSPTIPGSTSRWSGSCWSRRSCSAAGALLPVYFIAGWIADDQPREIAADDKDERKFWQGVRASPGQSARDIRGRMREIDRRLADIEKYVTTENRSLAREIEQLR